MRKVINLADHKNKKEEKMDIERLIKAIKDFPYNNKETKEQCNYYLEQYLRKINF
ncbi:hypothetical protein AAGC94_04220 [Clostridium sporogenes]|uniref:hypothetical protein n=1 Tax=Clostridium TaxID=1485 RepID=UPI0013D5B768|nr:MULTISPECIES: hypothetical protein [Clostridium]